MWADSAGSSTADSGLTLSSDCTLSDFLSSHSVPLFPPSLQPIRNNNPWMLLFFISFLLIVSFFVLNMFVGVVVENFHKCRQQQEEEEARLREEKRQRRLEKRRRSKQVGRRERGRDGVKHKRPKVWNHPNSSKTQASQFLRVGCWTLRWLSSN